jgi:hypothetical protein
LRKASLTTATATLPKICIIFFFQEPIWEAWRASMVISIILGTDLIKKRIFNSTPNQLHVAGKSSNPKIIEFFSTKIPSLSAILPS